VERCLACEADSGRHRRNGPAPPGKVTLTGAFVTTRLFLCAFDVVRYIKTLGGDPFGLASEAALHGWRPYPRKSAVRFVFSSRPFVSIRGPYSRRFAVPIVLSHQRRPTNRKRQSLRNSGGLPSAAWPRNWQIQPRVNSDNGIFQNPRISGASRKSGIETAIMGIPNVWKTRLTGF
jgi:hypothetical protein